MRSFLSQGEYAVLHLQLAESEAVKVCFLFHERFVSSRHSLSNASTVTPLLKVTLDDVLNRRHLPPLTLKDFEEWLVFVEGHPQYL